MFWEFEKAGKYEIEENDQGRKKLIFKFIEEKQTFKKIEFSIEPFTIFHLRSDKKINSHRN